MKAADTESNLMDESVKRQDARSTSRLVQNFRTILGARSLVRLARVTQHPIRQEHKAPHKPKSTKILTVGTRLRTRLTFSKMTSHPSIPPFNMKGFLQAGLDRTIRRAPDASLTRRLAEARKDHRSMCATIRVASEVTSGSPHCSPNDSFKMRVRRG